MAKVVLLIDGAEGLENMGKDCFKDGIEIVDFYHALEHAGKVLQALLGKNHHDYEKRRRRWAKRLLKDKVQDLIDQTRKECAGRPQAEAVEKELGYFVHNVDRMQYGTFRAAGYFIGSGVVLIPSLVSVYAWYGYMLYAQRSMKHLRGSRFAFRHASLF